MKSDVENHVPDSVELHTADEKTKPSALPRVIALFSLTVLALGVAWGARGVYFAFTDAWMAPIALSADNDQVLQINIKLNEQQVQREKLRVDVERIDADLRGIEDAAARLRQIQDNARESLRWAVFTTKSQSDALFQHIRALDHQQRLLDEMFARQERIASNATKSSEAGLLSKQELEREKLVLDQLRLGRVQNTRELMDARAQQSQLSATSAALGEAAQAGRGHTNGLPTDIATGQERDARLALELTRLESEKRALLAQRAIAADALGRLDDILKQLRSRPLYRAVEANTDVAFVPYSQLVDVAVKAAVIKCKWVLFGCETVGRIAEVLPGEVIAQDPWSQLARGQYVILDLDIHDSVKEKVLRARKAR